MKDLSIEEKAKRYDEALGKARQLCAYPTSKPFISDLQDLFPELKESDDERIRKELIRAFKSMNTIKIWNGIERTNILAWLEKQGEQKPVEWHREDEQNLNVCLSYIPDELPKGWLKDIIHTKYDKNN